MRCRDVIGLCTAHFLCVSMRRLSRSIPLMRSVKRYEMLMADVFLRSDVWMGSGRGFEGASGGLRREYVFLTLIYN